MSVHQQPSKANLVVHSLSKLYIGNVPHIEGETNKQAKDVHGLAHIRFCLMSISDDSVTIKYRSKYSLVEEVKENRIVIKYYFN